MHVFLSPHLDDAVLSCGGLIYRLSRKGGKPVIVTIMAGDPPDPLPKSPLINELHSRWGNDLNPIAVRRQEDEAAAATLGSQWIHMQLPDCIYRTANGVVLYPEDDDDLFGPLKAQDPAIQELKKTPLPEIENITHLYVPLGVGNHVDHQLVRQWAFDQSALSPTIQCFLYADYPYSRDPDAVEAALSQVRNRRLQPQNITLNSVELEQKLRAIACYASQISTFWDNEDAMQAQITQDMYNSDNERPGERFWQMSNTEE